MLLEVGQLPASYIFPVFFLFFFFFFEVYLWNNKIFIALNHRRSAKEQLCYLCSENFRVMREVRGESLPLLLHPPNAFQINQLWGSLPVSTKAF